MTSFFNQKDLESFIKIEPRYNIIEAISFCKDTLNSSSLSYEDRTKLLNDLMILQNEIRNRDTNGEPSIIRQYPFKL